MNILFMCKHNLFRSKLAEAIFNKLNTNHQNKACSVSVDIHSPVPQEAIEEICKVAKETGYPVTSERRQFDDEAVSWADLVINVADDVTLPSKYEKKLISWDIKDAKPVDIERRKEIISEIEERVSKLIESLKS